MLRKFVTPLTFIVLLSGCAKSPISTAFDIVDVVEAGTTSMEQVQPDEDSRVKNREVGVTETVLVTNVIDGDTIEFRRNFSSPEKGETQNTQVYKARLLCLNSPEDTSKHEAFGDVSTQFLTELIEGKEITIEHDKDATDKFGRELVHVFSKGQNVNQLMIEQGLARAAYLYDDYKFIHEYKQAEEIAKREERNIWSIPNYVNESTNGYDMSVIR